MVCGAEADGVDGGDETVYLEEKLDGEGLERGFGGRGGSDGLRRL